MPIMNNTKRFYLPSFADIILLGTFLTLVFSSGHNLLNDGDTGWHIRVGEYIIDNFHVPRHDMFSHISPPLPWFAHEWLSEVIMALVYSLAGLTGIVIFFSFLIALVYSLLFNLLRSFNCNIVIAAALVLLATVSSTLHWLARPHIFSLVLAILYYSILDRYQHKGKDRLYLLPILMLLWANLHGGFILGFLLLGVYFIGNAASVLSSDEATRNMAMARCKKLALFGVICLLFSLLNPRGYHLLLFPFETVSNQWLMDNVQEFLSPNFHKKLPYKYLLLLTIGVLAMSRAALSVIELVLVLLFTYMSLYSARYIPLFAIIVTPIVSRHIDGILQRWNNRAVSFFQKRSRNLELVDSTSRGHLYPAIGILLVCFSAWTGGIEFKFDENKKPVAAVEFLKKEHIPGKMFNNDEFGDYLIYATWPQYKVFFDGRSDMYGELWGKQYLEVVTLRRDWREILEKHHFDWIFISAGSPLSNVLLGEKEWHLLYADTVAHIFLKDTAENRPLIDKYPSVKPVKKNIDQVQ